jgi:predicted ester cyclase
MSRRTALRLGGSGLAAGAIAVVAVRAGTAQTPTASLSPSTESVVRQAVSAINRALATGDTSVLDAVFAPDYINHTPHHSLKTGQLQTADLAGLKATLTEIRAVVPDAVLLVEEIVAAADRAAVRLTFSGTLDAAATGLPGLSDGPVGVGGALFARVANGRIAESWDYTEAAELYGPAVRPQPATPEPARTGMRTETRDVHDFHAISLQGVGTLHIQQGDTESLTIEAENKVLDRIASEVQSGVLTIQPARSIRTRRPITYTLTVKQLDSIELSGAGAIEMDALQTDQLHLSASGAGSVEIDQLTAQTLDATVSGNTQATLGGTVDSQTVTLDGSARYDASALASQTATVTAQGATQAVVQVSGSLDATASGVSRIVYIGNPSVQQNVSGAASVSQAR